MYVLRSEGDADEGVVLVGGDDPLRAGLELELARVLGGSDATQDEAAVARELDAAARALLNLFEHPKR